MLAVLFLSFRLVNATHDLARNWIHLTRQRLSRFSTCNVFRPPSLQRVFSPESLGFAHGIARHHSHRDNRNQRRPCLVSVWGGDDWGCQATLSVNLVLSMCCLFVTNVRYFYSICIRVTHVYDRYAACTAHLHCMYIMPRARPFALDVVYAACTAICTGCRLCRVHGHLHWM